MSKIAEYGGVVVRDLSEMPVFGDPNLFLLAR